MSNSGTLVQTLLDTLTYEEGMKSVCRDASAQLIIYDETKPANIAGDLFRQIKDERDSRISIVNILSKIDVTDAAIKFWDYSRLTDLEGGWTGDFIFVHMQIADGWFMIWRGNEAATDRIDVDMNVVFAFDDKLIEVHGLPGVSIKAFDNLKVYLRTRQFCCGSPVRQRMGGCDFRHRFLSSVGTAAISESFMLQSSSCFAQR